MTTWTLIDYFDVWGNAEDGWEVNNQCEICNDLNITDDASEDDIIDYFIENGYLRPEAKGKVAIDEGWIDMFEIVEKDTWKPLYGVRKNWR